MPAKQEEINESFTGEAYTGMAKAELRKMARKHKK